MNKFESGLGFNNERNKSSFEKEKLRLPWKSTSSEVNRILAKEKNYEEMEKTSNNIEEQITLAQKNLTKEENADKMIIQALASVQNIEKTISENKSFGGKSVFSAFPEDLFA